MIKIAICDDDAAELELTDRAVKNFISAKRPNDSVTLRTFTSGMDLLCSAGQVSGYDLFILDILMPGINGLELAAEIRAKDNQCKIIFLSATPDFAVKSYKVDAFYYLLKPFSDDEFTMVLTEAFARIEEEETASIPVRKNGVLTRVKIHSIGYIESIKHNIYFHLRDGEVLTCYGTINEYTDLLHQNPQFLRCYKSFIVNMDFVSSITGKEFILSDKTVIPISRQGFTEVKNAYINYFFKKENGEH